MREELLANGYREFKPGPLDHEKIRTKYQKRFRDEFGTKYFITVDEWEPWTHPYTGETTGPGYEFETQLSFGEPGTPVNIMVFGNPTLKEAEEKIEEIFNNVDWNYYEKEE